MNFDTLEFSIDTHVAIIRLNRPGAANGINMQMAHELMQLAIECQENPEIRAVLLTGNGKMFSAGSDLKSFAAYGEQTTAKLHQLLTKLQHLDSLNLAFWLLDIFWRWQPSSSFGPVMRFDIR